MNKGKCKIDNISCSYILYTGKNLADYQAFDKSNLSAMAELGIDGMVWTLFIRKPYEKEPVAIPKNTYIVKMKIVSNDVTLCFSDLDFNMFFKKTDKAA